LNARSLINDELAQCSSLAELRTIRRRWTKQLAGASPDDVVAIAQQVEPRFIGYELVLHHPEALAVIDRPAAERIAGVLASWGEVDAFGSLLAGPAWLRGRIEDEDVLAWARSHDRWWRRASLVATTALNTLSRGGRGDTKRTITICNELVRDHDDMVVKALSWALRSLIWHDRAAVAGFLEDHQGVVAARVRREVLSKLQTGRKAPRRLTAPKQIVGNNK
jgi:3-methyladenine DNA glycosylase AlkD